MSLPQPPPPHLSHCQTLLPKTKIASEFSFVRRPRPSKTLAFEACAVPLAGNGAALLCLLQGFIPRSAPGGVGAHQGAQAAQRAPGTPYFSWVMPADLCGGYGWSGLGCGIRWDTSPASKPRPSPSQHLHRESSSAPVLVPLARGIGLTRLKRAWLLPAFLWEAPAFLWEDCPGLRKGQRFGLGTSVLTIDSRGCFTFPSSQFFV